MVIGTWERLGILVYRREIDPNRVDDAYSEPILHSWQRLEKYILEFRAGGQRQPLRVVSVAGRAHAGTRARYATAARLPGISNLEA